MTDVKKLQEQVGCLLYYALGVGATILAAINHVASLQLQPTIMVAAAMERLLQNCARFSNNTLVFTACDMRLFMQSDASYLSRPKARSVARGIFYLGNNNQPTTINGPCLTLSIIIPVVVFSVAEAEYAAVFMNAKDGASIRAILNSLGYPQPTIDILCDNICAVASPPTLSPRRRQNPSRCSSTGLETEYGKNNSLSPGVKVLADFFTKALPVHLHRTLMQFLVSIPPTLDTKYQTSHARRSHAWKLIRYNTNNQTSIH